MPDNNEGAQPALNADQQAQLNYDLSMAFEGRPPEPNQSTTNTDQGSTSNTNAATQVTDNGSAAASTTNEEVFDAPVFLKTHFGVEDPAVIKAQLEELQRLKSTPPVNQSAFKDDTHKTWYEYFANGEEDKLYTSLHARQQLKNVDSLNDEQRIKLFIKMNNPGIAFDQELIDYQYQKEYSFDESQFKDEDGNITDPMGLRYAKAIAQQKLQTDLNRANEFFAQHKQKIELQPLNTTNVDEAYESYKASNAKAIEAYNTSVVPSVKALKRDEFKFGIKVDDQNNQMTFDVHVIPEEQDFEEARNNSLDVGTWLQNTCYEQDGKFNAAKLQRLILLEKNFDKYAQSIARQAVNEERKRVIAKESGANGSVKDFNVVQPAKTELQKQADMAFSV